MAGLEGLFSDPVAVQDAVRRQRNADRAAVGKGFSQGARLGDMINKVGTLFGRPEQEDPRVTKAKKLQQIKLGVEEQVRANPEKFDTNSTLKLIQQELLRGGMVEEASRVSTELQGMAKATADIANTEADTDKKLEDTGLTAANREARERTNKAGLPEAQVESEKALAIQRKAAANKASAESNFLKSFPQTTRTKLGNAMAVFETEYPELWEGMDEPTKRGAAADVDALARTLERTVGPAQAMDLAIQAVGNKYVRTENGFTIPGTDLTIPLPGGTTTKRGRNDTGATPVTQTPQLTIGDVVDGGRYIGGPPNNPASWVDETTGLPFQTGGN